MNRQPTEGSPTLIERAGLAAVAGAGGAAMAAAGSYTVVYGIASEAYGDGGPVGTLFLLLLAIGIFVGGGAVLSKALGVSTWQRSTLISAAAHAIGLTLWFSTYNQIVIGLHTPGSTYGFDGTESGLVAFPAAAYAFVVPLIVLFSTFRRNVAKGLAITIPLCIGTYALAVTAVLLGSGGMAIASGVVAWVVLPAVSVLGLALIGPRNR